MREITKEFRTAKSGKRVTVKGTVIEKEMVSLDGHKVEVEITVEVEGHGKISGSLMETRAVHKEKYGEEYTHSFGPLLLTGEQAAIIQSVEKGA